MWTVSIVVNLLRYIFLIPVDPYREQREKDKKKQMDLKQQRRNENIAEYLAKKKARRLARRTGKKAPTDLKRPGFEGKKKKFINK